MEAYTLGKGKRVRFVRILIICLALNFIIFFAVSSGSPISMLLSSTDQKTNFVILGLDEGGQRSDTIIAGCLNTKQECVNLLSIPRDTLVTVPEERLAVLKQHNSYVPHNGQMKINAVYFYGGEEYGADFAVRQIEDLLDIKIMYYIAVDLEAFRYIVDEIGGIEYDVPIRMKYTDPYQNLAIDLQPGVQLLNGKQAEGLVRYRKSDDGSNPGYTDLNRAQTQQEFIKALAKKVTTEMSIFENATVLIPAWLRYTRTNIDAAATARYLKHIQQFKQYEIVPHMLVSRGEHISGVSYIIIDTEASSDVIRMVFGTDGAKAISSKGKPIKVLNGGTVSGLAAQARDYLTENGFMISEIGDYKGERTAHTRIFVKRKGMGKDIQALYPGSRIVVDEGAFEEEIVLVVTSY